MRVHEAVSDALLAEGAQVVFCVMGDGNLDLLSSLAARGVRLVHARHEQNAVAMADGYAAAGGFPALCSVTHGPGLTQTATSLAVAAARGTPLLLLAGDTPVANHHHVQNFAQEPFVAATGARLGRLRAAATVAEDVRMVMSTIRQGTGPVVFNMPTNVQLAELPAGLQRSYRPSSPPPLSAPNPADVERAAELILAADRPALLVGRGGVHAAPEIARVAELMEAPIITTLMSRGLLAAHPLSAGVSGGLGRPVAGELLAEADCVLAIGTSLSGFTTAEGAALANSTLIVVDSAAASHDAVGIADLLLQGDARLALTSLLSHLEAAPRSSDEKLRAQIAAQEPIGIFSDGVGTVDPRQAMIELDRCLPADRLVVTDGGHFGGFVCEHVRAVDPSSFLFAPAFGTIGQGLGIAIGAAFARPGQRVTLVAGDGGFLMNMQELETAVRYRLPLTVIVVNDQGYGQEYHSLDAKNLPADEAIIPTPDLAHLARSVGAEGHRISSPAELASLKDWLEFADGPMLVDIRVNRDVLSPGSREIFAAVRRGIDE